MSWDLPGPPGYSTHPRSCKEGKDARQSLNCRFANSLADSLSHYLEHSSGVKDVSTLSDESRALALPRIHRLLPQLEGKRTLRSVRSFPAGPLNGVGGAPAPWRAYRPGSSGGLSARLHLQFHPPQIDFTGRTVLSIVTGRTHTNFTLLCR